MKHHKFLRIILAVTCLGSFALAGCAQRPAQAPSGRVRTLEGVKVTLKGKIGYMERVSAYVVQGEAPYHVDATLPIWRAFIGASVHMASEPLSSPSLPG